MKKLIIGNWKLNPLTLKDAKKLASQIDRRAKHTAVICPPIAFLGQIDYPNLGAQDCFWQNKGAYTGQVSPVQLKDLGVKYCIVGHSERRSAGDTDEMVNAKVLALQASQITPVLCVGHGTTPDQDEFAVIDTIKIQLDIGLQGADLENIVVAYEPVWAIGTGTPATPDHAEKIAIYIKTRYHVEKVLYGASTNPSNAASFLRQPNIDGLLPGGASLLPDDFNKMINIQI